ncbi:MAG: hypothetical protein HeimC3_30770 [Candidatus Heimdallarchaeota archaeon LC_3]|nr:MAG: hypothetical protein HeimC3_30770 [Candidatus Heimdallarchaeota archaeon LC_3]
MQPHKPYTFLQEQIFQGIWPFSRFKSPKNVFLLTILYLVWGIGLYFLYDIPLYFLIAGIFAAISISLWTLGIFSYAQKMRNVEIESINLINKKFLVQYLEDLFHPSSIVFGVVLSTITYVFLLASPIPGTENFINILEREFQTTTLPPLVLMYLFLIVFDICYRLGLSSYVMIVQLKRNLRLSRYLNDKKLKKHFSPFNIKELEKADLYHYLALIAGFFLLPLVYYDIYLFIGLCAYLIISFIIASVNILHLRSLSGKAIPQKIKNLLNSSHLAYVGTLSDNNAPHVTPILYVFDGRHVFLATSIKSKKIKNLRKNKKLAVCIDNRNLVSINKSSGVLIQGKARVYGYNWLTSIIMIFFFGLKMLQIRRLFQKKYPEYIEKYKKYNLFIPSQWRINPIFSRTLIEINPDRFIYWKGTNLSYVEF